MIQPDFRVREASEQHYLPSDPYDRWITPGGEVSAEFHRSTDGYIMRFPGQADFVITADLQTVTCTPAPDFDPEQVATLYANSVRPVLGNHAGELNLHGSAVVIGGKALAIMGLSRRGKTTLAGALAKGGHPFLSEDVLALSPKGQGYLVAPQRPVLRVFADSAAYLVGDIADDDGEGEKRELSASNALPATSAPAPLGAICILGPGECDRLTISPMPPQAALAELMQHGFVLDVEDRARLSAHFERIASLASAMPCHALDYPRDFDQLPGIVSALVKRFGSNRDGNESD